MLYVFTESKRQGADGIILWGSSNDLKTEQQCKNLKNYLENTLGPIAHSFKNRFLVENIDSAENEYFEVLE